MFSYHSGYRLEPDIPVEMSSQWETVSHYWLRFLSCLTIVYCRIKKLSTDKSSDDMYTCFLLTTLGTRQKFGIGKVTNLFCPRGPGQNREYTRARGPWKPCRLKNKSTLYKKKRGKHLCAKKCSHTHDGTRTHNLTLRRGTPYPLGHAGRSTYR